jgi:hypothetical protein
MALQIRLGQTQMAEPARDQSAGMVSQKQKGRRGARIEHNDRVRIACDKKAARPHARIHATSGQCLCFRSAI